jgi:hypothetical protein
VPAQDVVVPHRCSLAYGLEHQILGAIRLDDLVSPDCGARSNVDDNFRVAVIRELLPSIPTC